MSTETKEPGTETEQGRRALLAEAQIYGVDLAAVGTRHPDGSVTLDWDVLARAVAEKRREPADAS